MKKFVSLISLVLFMIPSMLCRAESRPIIEVSGSAVINVVPDRISVEIGMEEYYKYKVFGDSTLVTISNIEKGVRGVLRGAGVPDSLVIVADMGNYRNRQVSANFLMAMRLTATVTDFKMLERIAEKLERKGITSFNVTGSDNSDMEKYNREGLKAALDAAREKAEFIASNSGVSIVMPYEIVETGGDRYSAPMFSNVAFDSGSGMENVRRIVRRYSVKVRYLVVKSREE